MTRNRIEDGIYELKTGETEANQQYQLLPWEEVLGYTADGKNDPDEVKLNITDRDIEASDLKAISIRIIESIDEISRIGINALPGIAAPVATAFLLTLSTPLVWLVVSKRHNEYKYSCRQFKKILNRKMAVEEKLLELIGFSEQWYNFIAKECDLKIDPPPKISYQKDKKTLEQSLKDMDERNILVYSLAEYRRLCNETLAIALGKKYGWTGAVGMAAICAGMGTAGAKAGIGIALSIHSAVALELAATILEFASAGLFLLSQGAMTIYSANRMRQGIKKRQMLRKDIEIFDKYSDGNLSANTQQNIREILTKQIDLIEKNYIKLGKYSMLGQAFMTAGTLTGLTGVGIAVTIPLFAVGTPLLTFAAIRRIIYQKKEGNFKGRIMSYVRNSIAEFNLINLIVKHYRRGEEACHKEILSELDRVFDCSTTQLAAIKGLSLLHHLINDRGYRNKTPAEKIAKLEQRLRGANNKIIGSEIEGMVVTKLKRIYQRNRDNISSLLSLAPKIANKYLLFYAIKILQSKSVEQIDKIFHTNPNINFSLNAEYQEVFSTLNIINFEKLDFKDLSKTVIKKGKLALKSVRMQLADAIIRTTQLMESRHNAIASGLLDEKPELKSGLMDSGISHPARTKSNYGTIQSREKTLPFNDFKKIIEQDYCLARTAGGFCRETLEKQQQIMEKIQRKTIDFILKEKKQDAANTVYVWSDPQQARNKPQYEIIYILDNKSHKIDVHYGQNAHACIFLNPKINLNKGARIYEINSGKVSDYGDKTNGSFRNFSPAKTNPSIKPKSAEMLYSSLNQMHAASTNLSPSL